MSDLPDCPECGPPCCPLNEYWDRIAELEAQVEALEGDGYMTAADFIEDWWNSANVQGVATMDGEEMMELVGSLRPDSERLIQRIIELPEADPNDENTVCINYDALRNVICNAALEPANG